MSKWRNLLIGAALGSACLSAPAHAEKLGLGRPALPEEINAWDMTVLPDGTGLRDGSGDVATGEEVFGEKCASCHGEFAEGLDSWPVLAGGSGTLTDARPVKTVGSYWPHLSTVWDYVHRSMPFGAAQTITVDEAYAITAFILYSNGLVEDDFTLSKENFASVKLPNEQGFYADDRPETEYPLFRHEVCMADCIAPVKITKRAADLKVTPTDPDGKPAGTLPALVLAAASDVTQPADAASEQGATEEPAMTEEPAVEEAAVDPALYDAGAKVFKKCMACHKVGEGAKNATGPMLNGIVGRVAGSVDGYKYSGALTDLGAGGHVWDAAALDAFLANPKAVAKGTKMAFAGLKSEDDRAAVIAYLSTFTE
jgi:S-disulfanyl-L-cysteine oxidoreductase SoxD